MKQNPNKKTNKATKILSYQKIKRGEVFGARKSFRKLERVLSEWKLNRLRDKAIQAENTENGSLYETLRGKVVLKGFLKLSFRKKLAVGVITAIIAVGGIFVYFQTRVGATTYQWLQATWSGGADTVNFPNHINNQSGWLKYFSKDTTQVKTDSGDVEINSTSGNYTETDNASGFSDALSTKSNTYTNGTGVLLKKNNGVACTTAQTTDYECTAGNCDADFSSGNYCHATATSCVDYALGTPWERVTGYLKRCSGNDYYKDCANSVWGSQVNSPDTANDYCDAGGGAQSGYDLLATCANGVGFTDPACTSCSPYIAASTSSCKTTCASGSDCWTGYECANSQCVLPCSASTACGTSCGYGGLTYGTLTANSKCWMDRNLGATAVATARDTAASYGDYYQWGRKMNGHQVSNSGTSATQFSAYTQDPTSGGLFIKGYSDWLNPQNNTLWAAAGGYLNNPCPTGWHVPAQTEWASVVSACGITNYTTAISNSCGLKLPASGSRYYYDASINYQGTYGYYWSGDFHSTRAYNLYFYSNGVAPADDFGDGYRAYGYSVRCLKN